MAIPGMVCACMCVSHRPHLFFSHNPGSDLQGLLIQSMKNSRVIRPTKKMQSYRINSKSASSLKMFSDFLPCSFEGFIGENSSSIGNILEGFTDCFNQYNSPSRRRRHEFFRLFYNCSSRIHENLMKLRGVGDSAEELGSDYVVSKCIRNETELRFCVIDPLISMICDWSSLQVTLEESVESSSMEEETTKLTMEVSVEPVTLEESVESSSMEEETTKRTMEESVEPVTLEESVESSSMEEEATKQTMEESVEPGRVSKTPKRKLAAQVPLTPNTKFAKIITEGSRADYTLYSLRAVSSKGDQYLAAVILEAKMDKSATNAIAQVLGYTIAFKKDVTFGQSPIAVVITEKTVQLILFPFYLKDDQNSVLLTALALEPFDLFKDFNLNLSVAAILAAVTHTRPVPSVELDFSKFKWEMMRNFSILTNEQSLEQELQAVKQREKMLVNRVKQLSEQLKKNKIHVL